MVTAQVIEKPRSGFIAGPIRDTVFLIASPLLAVLVFAGFSSMPILNHPLGSVDSFLSKPTLTDAFIHVVIFGHLFIVFFRSHANRSIFRLHRLRFTVVPAGLFLLAFLSPMALAAVAVLAIWWDVYHSALQTFGIGRIYDMKAGNDPQVGRRLDWWLNVLLYVGPILGGASLMLHLTGADPILQRAPETARALFEWRADDSTRRLLTLASLGISIPFCAYYIWAYRSLARQGYRVSYQKVSLMVILAMASIICWGFSPFGCAFFVMNFFHAWQYFFIVWVMEKKSITSFFGLSRIQGGPFIALALFVFIATAYGVWTTVPALQLNSRAMLSLMFVISIMHFWYDGFIWSVRKGQIK